MAYDLIVWKWAGGKEGADPSEILDAISEDDPHPALTRFDIQEFESALRARFGDVNDDQGGPFLYEVSDFAGIPANWITFSLAWSQTEKVRPLLVGIARSHGLAVYDPQEDTMV
ncbi:MAG: hypothetical protein U0790_20400 [Isosphaeraceae bacterium]